MRSVVTWLMFVILCSSISAVVFSNEEIDWEKAREIRRKARSGQSLSEQEREYLERAKEARQRLRVGSEEPAQPTQAGSVGCVPVTDLDAGGQYKGEDGGLYSGGRNEPPDSHLKIALEAARKIRPLDNDGSPAADGKIVLMSVGMSNTTQEFSAFMHLAQSDPEVSKSIVLFDGAQGGQDARDWAYPEERFRPDKPSVWKVLEERIEAAGVSKQQVQVAWIKGARRNPASLGEFPKHVEELKNDTALTVGKLKQMFPNLGLAYLSSRTYAGYARSPLNPEPYAYESAFAVRGVILDQIRGEESLNCDPKQGEVVAPVLLWGPYLWADGAAGRKIDDLVWRREDFARDGTHPSESGRKKVAQLLLEFFKTDPTAKDWYTAK